MKKYFLLMLFSIIINQEISINKIEIDGLIRLKEDDIFRISKLYPGLKIIKGDEINNALERLWDIGRFSNVQIFVIEEFENTLSLKIIFEELPIVNSIKFIGNDKISDKKLEETINISYGQIISKNLLFESKNSIEDLYKNDQFHNVVVQANLIDTDKNFTKDLVFNIKEGNKIKIKNVSLIGNSHFLNKEILKNMKSLKIHNPILFWRGKFSNENFENDLLLLASFYKNNGYKDFQVVNKNIIYNKNGIDIILELYEGEKYYYNNISFEGNHKFSDDKLLETLDINKNDIYNEEKLNLALYDGITSLYMDQGYYFFNISNEIQPVDSNRLDIKFIISENEKVKIRKVLIAGNNKTYENVIRREIQIYPGDVFNRKNIIDSIKQLFLLNYFQDVSPKILPVSNEEIDIKFVVIEKETGRANFSMGYNELHGFTGGGGFEFSNFMGKGQILGLEYQRGLQNQLQSNGIVPSTSTSSASDYESFSIRFREPRILDTRNSAGISFSHQEQGQGQNNIYKYSIESDRFSLSFGRRFKWPDIFVRGDWAFSISNTKYFGDESELLDDFDPDFSDSAESDIVSQNGSQYYALKEGISLNQIISRDTRDHPEFPTIGSQLVWSTTLSGGILGGNVNYNKNVLSFTWYTPIIDKTVLFQNYKFGVINELTNNKFIPYNARFLMGGSGIPSVEMLRGYDNNSIGPGSNYYSSEEGKIMLKYSMEIRYLLSESPIIYMLAFGEAGNVWTDFNNVDLFDLKRSAGIGIRLFMPMLGILGYDIGYGFDNIDGTSEPSGWEHHIIFGMPFN